MSKKETFPGTEKPELLNEDVDVKVTVKVKYLDDNSPATGTRIFEHYPNALLGTIPEEGKVELNVPNGTMLRLVEPQYGLQQSIQQVIGIKDPNGIAVASMGEGWTL
jgi:hypothetical protein